MSENLVSVETQSEFSFMKDAVSHGLVGDMGPESWTTLCVIVSFMDGRGECYPTQKQIAERLGVHRQTANRCVSRLLDYRWKGLPVLVAERARDNGQFSALKYILKTPYLIPAKENPYAVLSFNTPHGGVELSDDDRVITRSIPGYARWVEEVKQLANYTCIKCGSSDKVVAHHIDNYRDFPEKRTSVDNGACLCEKCHRLFHSVFGISGTARADFSRFLGGDYRWKERS